MRYDDIAGGEFLARPNRFIAEVIVSGVVQRCHVKNTGRLGELLIPGARVWLQKARGERKTPYDLIAVEKDGKTVNIDSQAPNALAFEYFKALLPENALVRREVKYKDSRFDIYYESGERRDFCEVKGVTLERNGAAVFPDAPTARGRKHVRELIELKKQGYEATLLFIIQMSGAKYLTTNKLTDPAFCEAVTAAEREGVAIRALECAVAPGEIVISRQTAVITEEIKWN